MNELEFYSNSKLIYCLTSFKTKVMRKIYKMASLACFGLALSTSNNNAQVVSDFENLTLPVNSHWDGSDLSGTHNAGIFSSTFNSGDGIFPNVFDTAYGALYGYMPKGAFAYSNKEDNTTTGEGYSSFALGTTMGDNYAIGKDQSKIHLTGTTQGTTLTGMYVTNSTYSAISMRDGDYFGKVFGDSVSAAYYGPLHDGSNGNDFFLLTIKGYSGGIMTTDSVDFYLADFRFSNNTQDYILNTWEWVDLSGLGNVDSVQFFLNSSDTTGGYGMNTPDFFCFDNFNSGAPLSVNEMSTNKKINVHPNPANNILNIDRNIVVTKVSILDITGKVVKTAFQNQLNVSDLSSGIHFLKIETKDATYTEKFVKQ